MGWMVQDRAAVRHVAALAALIAAVRGGGLYGGRADGLERAPEASGAPASGHWGPAVPVPGLGGRGLNAGGQAWVSSVSCASAGNCAIGGSYRDGHRHGQAYVVSERNGRCGSAIEIPGTVVLLARRGSPGRSCACERWELHDQRRLYSASSMARAAFLQRPGGPHQSPPAITRQSMVCGERRDCAAVASTPHGCPPTKGWPGWRVGAVPGKDYAAGNGAIGKCCVPMGQ